MTSRRTWIKHLGAMAAAPLLATPGRRLEVDRILDRVRSAHWTREQRQYRVDAALTVLTSPVHWFRDIGYGFLALEEASGPLPASILRFGAASRTENARGFDRTGFIEEVSVHPDYASFGFITAGHESRSGAGAGFTAMDLLARGEQCWFRRAGISADGPPRQRLEPLISAIRGAFPDQGGIKEQVRLEGALPTFLQAVRQAVTGSANQFHCTYVHNAKQFDLAVVRKQDAQVAALLTSKGLTKRPEAVRRYDGCIRDGAGQTTNRQWSFRFWREEGSSIRLPLRVEFQPKPILKLSLELTSLRTV